MKKYTLGEMVDIMKLGEVAIKVEGNFDKVHPIEKYKYVKGVHYDENDNGILKELDGSRIVFANSKTDVVEYFIILSKEDYQRVLDTRRSLVASAY